VTKRGGAAGGPGYALSGARARTQVPDVWRTTGERAQSYLQTRNAFMKEYERPSAGSARLFIGNSRRFFKDVHKHWAGELASLGVLV
jgi:hypothetical protein